MSDEEFYDDGSEAGEPDIDEADNAGAAAFDRLFAADGPADLDDGEFAGPLYWPTIPAVDLRQELEDLYVWVQRLLERFEHLDHKVIPVCWWRHNGHIEALQALRDHERMSYADTAPAQAATSFHREFQFIEMRLREFTAAYGCSRDHKERSLRATGDAIASPDWEAVVSSEQQARQQRELGLDG